MVKSTASTASYIHEKNETFQQILDNQIMRYKRKGYGLITASLIVFFTFIILPKVAKQIWPQVLFHIKPNNIQYMNFLLVSAFHFLMQNLIIPLIQRQLAFYIIYTKKYSFFERYRINPEKKWAWEEKDPQIWNNLYKKCIISLLYDNLIQVSILYLSVQQPIDYKWSLEDFPDSFEIMIQITFFMLTEDFFFYWGHRILHIPYFYKKIHKQHHEFKNPIAFSTVFLFLKSYAHPLEYLLCNFTPFIIGFVVLGKKSHIFTILIWSCIRISEAIDGHCGYEFSWSPFRLLPMSGSSSYHNYHHTHNIGNYGSFFTIWDTVYRTNADYYKYLARLQENDDISQMKKDD